MMANRFLVKEMAHLHGNLVTILPRPWYGDNGSGMRPHQLLFTFFCVPCPETCLSP
ncbi:hypothetical protein H5T52_00060 [Candidatus Bipolaricaulota bacterium]|nr:hypothetical protein [Candidatus Bipolaricaulota bacterium]